MDLNQNKPETRPRIKYVSPLDFFRDETYPLRMRLFIGFRYRLQYYLGTISEDPSGGLIVIVSFVDCHAVTQHLNFTGGDESLAFM